MATRSRPRLLSAKWKQRSAPKRDSWPIAALRRFSDVLIEVAAGRKKSPRHEVRWLNLFGFCLRPGFGVPGDDARVNSSADRRVERARLRGRSAMSDRNAGAVAPDRRRHQCQQATGALSQAYQWRREEEEGPPEPATSSTRRGAWLRALSTCPPASVLRLAMSCWRRSEKNPKMQFGCGRSAGWAPAFRSTGRCTL